MKGIQDNKKVKDLRGEEGMMVVEAVISFTIFIMVSMTIVYLINIFTIHNKIQFAINSAAHEIASYSYLYEVLGIRDGNKQIVNDGDPYVSNIDNTVTQVVDSMNKIQGLYSNFNSTASSIQNMDLDPSSINSTYNQLKQLKSDAGSTVESVKKSAADLKSLFSDGNGLLAGIIYLGAYEAQYEVKSMIGSAAASALTQKYLKSDTKSADRYLQQCGVIDGYDGLDFSGSTLFADSDMRIIDIVVEYDIDLGFARLVLPEAKLHVIQRVSVPAWLDGDGQTVPQ